MSRNPGLQRIKMSKYRLLLGRFSLPKMESYTQENRNRGLDYDFMKNTKEIMSEIEVWHVDQKVGHGQFNK